MHYVCKLGNTTSLHAILENDFSLTDVEKNDMIKSQGPIMLGPLPKAWERMNTTLQEVENCMVTFGVINHVHINLNRFATIYYQDTRSNEAAEKYFRNVTYCLFNSQKSSTMKVILSGNGYLSPVLLNTFLTGFINPWTPFQPDLSKRPSQITERSSNPFTITTLSACTLPTPPWLQSQPKYSEQPHLQKAPVIPFKNNYPPKHLVTPQTPATTPNLVGHSTIQLEHLAFQINSRIHLNHGNDGITNYSPIATNKDKRTTLMIRNIPNKYTQEMLIDHLNTVVYAKYTFLYLRMASHIKLQSSLL